MVTWITYGISNISMAFYEKDFTSKTSKNLYYCLRKHINLILKKTSSSVLCRSKHRNTETIRNTRYVRKVWDFPIAWCKLLFSMRRKYFPQALLFQSNFNLNFSLVRLFATYSHENNFFLFSLSTRSLTLSKLESFLVLPSIVAIQLSSEDQNNVHKKFWR